MEVDEGAVGRRTRARWAAIREAQRQLHGVRESERSVGRQSRVREQRQCRVSVARAQVQDVEMEEVQASDTMVAHRRGKRMCMEVERGRKVPKMRDK